MSDQYTGFTLIADGSRFKWDGGFHLRFMSNIADESGVLNSHIRRVGIVGVPGTYFFNHIILPKLLQNHSQDYITRQRLDRSIVILPLSGDEIKDYYRKLQEAEGQNQLTYFRRGPNQRDQQVIMKIDSLNFWQELENGKAVACPANLADEVRRMVNSQPEVQRENRELQMLTDGTVYWKTLNVTPEGIPQQKKV